MHGGRLGGSLAKAVLEARTRPHMLLMAVCDHVCLLASSTSAMPRAMTSTRAITRAHSWSRPRVAGSRCQARAATR